MVAGEVAAKHRDLQQVSGERGRWKRGSVRDVDPVEHSDLGEGENVVGRSVWLGGTPPATGEGRLAGGWHASEAALFRAT